MRGWRTAGRAVRLGVALLVGVGLLLGPGPLGPRPAQAATFVVNDLGDAQDSYQGDGRCDTTTSGLGVCTLRAAIEEANATPGADTITFLVNGVIAVGSELLISEDVTIIGNGPSQTVLDGGGTDRVLHVASGANVELRGLTIQKGLGTDGGGIFNEGTLSISDSAIMNNRAGTGGGIFNKGTLSISDSAIMNNGADTAGGGISNTGTLMITNSTISGNTSPSGFGGGIYNTGTLTITNSTISGNSADIRGGGIYNLATLTLRFSTLSGNSARSGGGGLYNDNGTVKISASIIANSPSGGDCAGSAITSQGYNLDSDGSCGLSQSTDRSNVDPKLEPLADNGGPTLTHALRVGSPALDLVDPPDCPPPDTDQRGVRRPQDGDGDGTARCDSGAYERRGAAVASPTATPRPAERGGGSGSGGHEEDKRERLTELERLQRERTNALGIGDYRTEGDVLAVVCEAGAERVVIGTVEGEPEVRLLGEAARACGGIRPGDYLEAEGRKVNERLFEAERVRIERRRR